MADLLLKNSGDPLNITFKELLKIKAMLIVPSG